ncbi:MAG: 30S ribosomal protein S12 methylthiotransferase RimO [Bacteroidales bacterium]|nr:30S ribosomal protein S12 methylthiotransferase RimO [Bacteroidales bacterium]
MRFPEKKSSLDLSLIERKINIISLGCSKNTVDSEQLAYQLKMNDFKVVFESKKHLPISIINTCGFIQDAKEQSIEIILDCIKAKSEGKIKVLIVFGCLYQRYKEELATELPEVDAFFGVHDADGIVNYLQAEFNSDYLKNRLLSTPSHYSYLKISEGCNHRCSFCAIPNIRGKYVSKPLEQLINEAEIMAQEGVKELILIAQDLTYYGIDLYKKSQLSKLLKSLLKIQEIDWIRLHYAYPSTFPLDILDVMNENEKVCKYLDLPLQHINDDILHSMKRNTTEKEIRSLIDTIRKKVPDAALRTSFIVGYPGETKKIYRQLEAFINEIGFDRLGVFTYSHEEKTAAYLLKNTISKREKESRKENLMFLQQEISLTKNTQKIGSIYKVLIDTENKTHYIGRTEFDSPEVDNLVYVSKKAIKCDIGGFYSVKITKAEAFDLYGEVVEI